MGFSLWILTMTTLVQVRYNCYRLHKKLFLWNKSIIRKQEKSETTLSSEWVFVGFGGEHVLIMNNYLTLVILKSQTPLSIVTNPLTHRIVAFTFPEICCIVVDIHIYHTVLPVPIVLSIIRHLCLNQCFPRHAGHRWTARKKPQKRELDYSLFNAACFAACLLWTLTKIFSNRHRSVWNSNFESCTIVTIWSTLKNK